MTTETAETIDPSEAATPRRKPGPKGQDLVSFHGKIRKSHRKKIEAVRKQQKLDTASQALRFMLDEWG